MTEFYHPEQPLTNLPEHSPLSTRTNMPTFYSPNRHRTLFSKHLTDHDVDDHDSIYKEDVIIQMFQHWKIKTLEHQQTINHAGYSSNSKHASPILPNTVSSVTPNNIEANTDETSSNNNKDEVSNVSESDKSVVSTMKKRATPLVATQARRKAALQKTTLTPDDVSNPKLLSPHTITKPTSTTASNSPKKAAKPGPIFIAPKKTQPYLPPRSYNFCSIDESAHQKRRVMLEKQNSMDDDQPNSSLSTPTWAPAPPTRFYSQSASSSLDLSDSSSDESDHESLLIRNKRKLTSPTKSKDQDFLPLPSHFIIPNAVFITDPEGQIHSVDLHHEQFNTEAILDNNPMELQANVFKFPAFLSAVASAPVSPIVLDQYALHSIGEEEEEPSERNVNNRNILSKELGRIEAFSRSRQSPADVQTHEVQSHSHENKKLPLERRWSDGGVSDDENNPSTPPPTLVKMASAASLMKTSAATPPVKLSKTKLLLMKLHLAPSPSSKDDPPAPPRKRTVRRSSDKKRYQTQ